MPDAITTIAPDLSLIVGPDDSAFQVGSCPPPRKGGRWVSATIHIAVHRRHGLWTHVYRVLQEDRPDRQLVHLHKVFEGERTAEARSWALTNLVGAAQA